MPETRNRYSGVFEMFGWRFQGVAIRFQMAARPSDSAVNLADASLLSRAEYGEAGPLIVDSVE